MKKEFQQLLIAIARDAILQTLEKRAGKVTAFGTLPEELPEEL
ncbi:MAG: hypothetical protein PWQ29_1474, partial [Verrucomicrobiota bacterium]|nr:hypothetical protein [Verrucomicrobiota bacterium]